MVIKMLIILPGLQLVRFNLARIKRVLHTLLCIPARLLSLHMQISRPVCSIPIFYRVLQASLRP
jgi:hypothetical protein